MDTPNPPIDNPTTPAKFEWSAMRKILSARFILALIAGGTFSYLACTTKIEPEQSMNVIVMVVTFYFARHRTNGQDESL